jgi:hypothetical protein
MSEPSLPPVPKVPTLKSVPPSVPLALQVMDRITLLFLVALFFELTIAGKMSAMEFMVAAPTVLGIQTGIFALASRGRVPPGTGGALSLLGALAISARHAGYFVLVFSLAIGAATTGCRLPPRDGCIPESTRCNGDYFERCSATERWHHLTSQVPCSSIGAVCCLTRSHYANRAPIHACAPAGECLAEATSDGGVSND